MVKKIIGALMILVFFGTIFISSIIVHGLIETLMSIFIEIVLDINNIIIPPTVDVIKDILANLYIAQYINVNTIATKKFIKGPAADTIASPFSIEIFLV